MSELNWSFNTEGCTRLSRLHCTIGEKKRKLAHFLKTSSEGPDRVGSDSSAEYLHLRRLTWVNIDYISTGASARKALIRLGICAG